MATRSVDILIKARDEASAVLKKAGGGVQQLSARLRTLKGIGRTLLTGLGIGSAIAAVYSLISVARSSISAFFEQEKAARSLSDALTMIGVNAARAMPDMQAFAAGIQSVTTIGDEAVLQMMSMAAAMSRLSGDALKKATVAAIGLSKQLSIDTTAAMRLVARAALGDTAQLKRYGVVLELTLSPQEKFNELLRIGADAFQLAAGEAETAGGKIDQLKNRWGDLKEGIGEVIWALSEGALAIVHLVAPDTTKELTKARMEAEKQADAWSRLAEAVGRVRALESIKGAGLERFAGEGAQAAAAQRLEEALQAVNVQVKDFNYLTTDIREGGLLRGILETTDATRAYANTLDDLRKKAEDLRAGQMGMVQDIRAKLVGDIGTLSRQLDVARGLTTEGEQQVALWTKQYDLTEEQAAVLTSMVETAVKLKEAIARVGEDVSLPWVIWPAEVEDAMAAGADEWLAKVNEVKEAVAETGAAGRPEFMEQRLLKRAPGSDPMMVQGRKAEQQRGEQLTVLEQIHSDLGKLFPTPTVSANLPW